jgi:hypothetical protein
MLSDPATASGAVFSAETFSERFGDSIAGAAAEAIAESLNAARAVSGESLDSPGSMAVKLICPTKSDSTGIDGVGESDVWLSAGAGDSVFGSGSGSRAGLDSISDTDSAPRKLKSGLDGFRFDISVIP